MSAAKAIARRPRPDARAIVAALLPGRRARRRLSVLAALALALAAGYVLWLRDSSLVQVQTVKVTGFNGPSSERIRAALTATARGMTTLHVDRAKLERAASAFPVLRAIEVDADFPHGMRIHVLPHRPAAILAAGSHRVAVAADGTVLTGLQARGELPLIRMSGPMPASRVPRGIALARVRVAGGIPAILRARVKEVAHEPGKGVVALLEDGPKLIFGDGTRVAAKWAAAVGVLADRAAAGAAYVDVRIPERPAAGGLPVKTLAPVAPAEPPSGAPVPAPSGVPAPLGPASSASPVGSAGAAPGTGSSPLPAPPARAPAAPAPRAPVAPAGQGGGTAPEPQP